MLDEWGRFFPIMVVLARDVSEFERGCLLACESTAEQTRLLTYKLHGLA
jgi:hypothetical protein